MFASEKKLQQEAERNRAERALARAESRKARQTGYEARLAREDVARLRAKQDSEHAFALALLSRPKESPWDSLSRGSRLEKEEETLSPSDVTAYFAPANPRRLLLQVRRHKRALQDIDPKWDSRSARAPQRLSKDERYALQEEADAMLRRYESLQDYTRSALRAACEAIRTPDHGLTDQTWWCRFFEVIHGVRWFLRDSPERKRVFLREELRSWPEVQRRERPLVKAAQAKPEYKAAQASKKRDDRRAWSEERRAQERKGNSERARLRRQEARRAQTSNVASGHGDMDPPGAVAEPQAVRRLPELDGARDPDVPAREHAGPRGVR